VASKFGNISCRVPQRSVLGPLLYLIYVNDISRVINEYDLKLFADDTNLFIAGPSLYDIESKANRPTCLGKINIWFLANKLSLNVDETCYTVFTSKFASKDTNLMNLTIGGQMLKKVSSCKYLGIFIDEKLMWD